MKAVFLAAGEGSRLRPYTDDTPKPLVELGDTSLLERNVATLAAAGVRDVTVVTGYRAEVVRERGFDTVHNPDYAETDMVYSLFAGRESFPEGDDLLVSYGDIVYEQGVVERLLTCGAQICVVVDRDWRQLWERRFDDPLADAETLSVADGLIDEIGGEPESMADIEAQYVGLISVRADYVDRFVEEYDRLPDSHESGIEMTAFLDHLIDRGWEVAAVPIDGGWIEVDTVADLDLYRDLHSAGELSAFVDLERTGT